jgi:hypothetical protein
VDRRQAIRMLEQANSTCQDELRKKLQEAEKKAAEELDREKEELQAALKQAAIQAIEAEVKKRGYTYDPHHLILPYNFDERCYKKKLSFYDRRKSIKQKDPTVKSIQKLMSKRNIAFLYAKTKLVASDKSFTSEQFQEMMTLLADTEIQPLHD